MPFPQSSLCLLELFAQKRISLTQKEFDNHFDAVLEVLEQANEERYRITPEGDEELR